jgi:hypothetical protein
MKRPMKSTAKKVEDRDDDGMAKGGKVGSKMPMPAKGAPKGGLMIMIGVKPKKK